MEYYIWNISPYKRKEMQISREEFALLKEAKEKLGLVLSLTESYRVVIESYKAVEIAKFTAELEHVLYGLPDYIDISNVRVSLNSPMSGYLSSSRHYLYVLETKLKQLSPEGHKEFKKICHQYYDSNLEYRFVEALRNHVQHHQLPIDIVKFHNYNEPGKEISEAELVSCISVLASKASLEKNDDFKKAVLNELSLETNIIASIRVHMEGIWKFHTRIKPFVETISKEQKNIIVALFDKFEKETGDFATGLNVVEIDANGLPKTDFNVTTEWEEARLLSLDRLGNLVNLGKRYITGKIQRPQAK